MKKIFAILLCMCFVLNLCACDFGTKAKTKTLTAANGDEIVIKLKTSNKPEITVSVNGKEYFNCKDFKDFADQYDFENDFNFEIVNEYSEEIINWAYQFKWGMVLSTTVDSNTSYWVSAKHQYEDNVYRQEGLRFLVEEWELIELNSAGNYWSNEKLAEAIVETMYETTDYSIVEVLDFSKAGYADDNFKIIRNMQRDAHTKNQKTYEVYVKDEVVALLCIDASWYYVWLQELDWDAPQRITYKNERG